VGARSLTVDGTVSPGFERVADAFAGSLDGRPESSQCCIHVDGEAVVDLWVGRADAIEVVFSATKGATAACANLLVQRGLLDLDAPVATYWPEFGSHGKEATLVRWLLSHKAGVLAPQSRLTMDDLVTWATVASALASAEPAWEPGSAYGYHAQSLGWLVGELVRRVDGRSLGAFFAEEIAGPAGADFWIGLPEDQEYRVAQLEPPPILPGADMSEVDLSEFVGPRQVTAFTLNGALPEDLLDAAADRRFRAGQFGAAGGVSNGRGLSRMYRWLLEEFTAQTVEDILRPETEGPDLVVSSPAMVIEQVFGRGFDVAPPTGAPVGARTFGHTGAGGMTAFCDPDRRLAFGYATTSIIWGPPGSDARASALVEAVYSTLNA